MLKRLLLSAALTAACSSGGATPTAADAGGASQGACEALCAASTCSADCASSCTAGGAAVARCQPQYEAVVRCAARNGQRCNPTQGGGPGCASEAQAYSACLSGDTDAGSSTTDAGSTGTDAGTTGVDAGAVAGPSVAGRWTFSRTSPSGEYELDLMGGPTTGAVRYQSVLTLETSGCVTTNAYSGRWTRTGGALSVTFEGGTTEVTMCNDSSRNSIAMALPEESVTSIAAELTGPITVSETELTFTMFRGSSTRTFGRTR